MANRTEMPRRVPPNLDERINHMIQIWEEIGSEKVFEDLSLTAVRDIVAARQTAKNEKLLADSAQSLAQTNLRQIEENAYVMTVQTLDIAGFVFGKNSPQYKLAGGTPLSERGKKGKNKGKPAEETLTNPTTDSPM